MGEIGPTGPTGAAATIQVGSVTTGEPGTNAEVTNSGTENDAIFDFVIPRGEPGSGGGAPDVLATTDNTGQPSTTGTPLTFNNTPLISGNAITHNAGSSDIVITQPGIYQAAFQGTVSVNPGTDIPASILTRLTLNGTPIVGATARYTFTASGQEAELVINVPFQVDSTPATLQVVPEADGFTFNEMTLSVLRLGDAGAT